MIMGKQDEDLSQAQTILAQTEKDLFDELRILGIRAAEYQTKIKNKRKELEQIQALRKRLKEVIL